MKEESRMRIRSIQVKNFKSLVDLDLALAKFTCLIGLNGVGKSTVLQFIDFLSQLVRGDMTGWLEERQWKPRDVRSKLTAKKNVEFCVRFDDAKARPAGHWEGHYNPSENRCTWERIDTLDYVLETTADEVRIIKVKERASDGKDWKSSITFSYEGSILSALKKEFLPESILKCRSFFQAVESLDMLTPERLRLRTRNANGSLGHGGRNLSAFLYDLGGTGQTELAKKLKRAYPHLRQVYVKSLRSGWKQLHAREMFGETKLWTEARHINDGLLRLLAILAEVASRHSLVLFDEIENGINPELVEFVIDILVKATQQVLVTTHSPMILNYLDDDTAKRGVVYLYKTPQGFTESIPFFSIPSLKKKLTVMGPGEAFVDTNLTELAEEIAAMTTEET
jgi:ABC-type multidrug transport system ATPase subunit